MLFEWDPASGNITGKISFSESLGYSPCWNLTLKNGKLYGFTTSGGANNKGIIFEWDPVLNVYNKRRDLTAFIHNGSRLTLLNNKLYGATSEGGANGVGTFFEWDPITNNLTTKLNRTISDGLGLSELTVKDGKFYGTARYGGVFGNGTIFEWDPATNHFQKRLDFPHIGNEPLGLTLLDGKFYGITADPELYHTTGALFEWDPVTNQFEKKQDLTANTSIGIGASSSLLVMDGKLYGVTKRGGYQLGSLFEWEPVSNALAAKVDFGENDGTPLVNSMTAFNGKFYGVTRTGGSQNKGVIFEWDPVTRVFTKEFDFSTASGIYPRGGLTLFEGRLYGATESGGSNNAGVIFEWDPVFKIFEKKVDLQFLTGYQLTDFSVANGKFFGVARGGTQNGGIFEWDPTSNLFAIKYSFDWELYSYHKLNFVNGKFYGNSVEGKLFEWDPLTNGFSIKTTLPEGSIMESGLIRQDGILYGVTFNVGPDDKGILFSWDPASNLVAKKVDLPLHPARSIFANNGKFYLLFQNGDWFEWGNDEDVLSGIDNMSRYRLSEGAVSPNPISAPVSDLSPGTCSYVGSCLIASNNSSTWVPVIDAEGNAIAEINANGNELGLVTVYGYAHDAATREDGSYRLYLDRNLTITPEYPQIAVGAPVSVRFYIKKGEFEKLRTSTNSLGLSSGIGSPEDLGIFSNPSNICSADLHGPALQIDGATIESWGEDYVLSAQITSFSTFYFSAKEFSSLPVSLVSFSASYGENMVSLNWRTAVETNVSHFEVERSTDSRKFQFVQKVMAKGSGTAATGYRTADTDIADLPSILYYRLKSVDIDGGFSYSSIVPVKTARAADLLISPNPVDQHLIISGSLKGVSRWEVLDMAGRIVKNGNNVTESLDVKGIPPGVYILRLRGDDPAKAIRFVKK